MFPLQELFSRIVFRRVSGKQGRSHVVEMVYIEVTDSFQSELFPLNQFTGLIEAVEEGSVPLTAGEIGIPAWSPQIDRAFDRLLSIIHLPRPSTPRHAVHQLQPVPRL